MENNLVSVIMPAYNAEAYIASAIQSVQEQSFSNWELLVIEDASTDATLKIIKKIAERDWRIKIIENVKNEGTGYSRNKGIKACKGTHVAFLDADDIWKPKKLETQLHFMHEQDIAVCYGSYERLEDSGKLGKERVEALPFLTYRKILKSNYIGNLTGMYSVEKLGKIYGPSLKKRQDWGLWIKAIKKGGTAKGILEPLAYYRDTKNSASSNKLGMLPYNFKIYYKVLGFGLFKSLKYMILFFREQFFIKSKQIKLR